MRQALELACRAGEAGEIPVGALVVFENRVVAARGNSKELSRDPLGHAEIFALRDASMALGRWRLTGCTLYVTLEPCTMCAGAIVHSRVDRVVFAATDPKAGAVVSLYHILSDSRLNHSPLVTGGVLRQESAILLKSFFRSRR